MTDSWNQPLFADWTNDEFGTLEKGVLLAKHPLSDTGFFTDEYLAEVIDTHPDEDMSITTMGDDANQFEWLEGDRNGVSGEVLLELVRKGRLWINLRKMMDHHGEFRELINTMYDELESKTPGFRAKGRTANLLLSSPNALVHYHIDLPVNMLWHIRGRKRVWVYPHFDHRFVSQKVVELVCSGNAPEDVPYDADFDRYALQFDVDPGQLLTWPQMTPHRVTNLDGLNVSLSTEHHNARAARRINVNFANHLLRQSVGLGCGTDKVDGLGAHLKQAIARGYRYANKLVRKPAKQFTYPTSFVLDPASPTGYTLLNQDSHATHQNRELVETV